MRIPSDIQVVLFDLDGTLIDHEGAARAGVLDFAAHFHLPGTPEEIVRRWFAVERRWYTRFERGKVTHTGQRVERLREFLGRDMTEDEALETYQVYLAAYRRSWHPFADAASALDRAFASGRRVGVFTNGATDMQNDKLAVTGLQRPDLVMLAATNLGAAKPRPESYAAALERMGLAEASRSVLIGDDLNNDVRGARKAGMSAVYLNRAGGGDVASLDEVEF